MKKIISNISLYNDRIEFNHQLSYKSDSDHDECAKISEEKRKVNEDIFKKYLSDCITFYQDFDSHSDQKVSDLDFNWEDHAFDTLKKFFYKIEEINNEINYVANLTSNTIGNENYSLKTNLFRNSISSYIENIFGYIHHDFDYSQVNKVLDINHKLFIKNVCCSPHKISKKLFEIVSLSFSYQELLHMILLSSTIKFRLQLNYLALRIHQYWKNVD